MRTRVLLLVLAFFVLAGSSANADDTRATLAAGGLVPVKSTQVVMESEDLEISVHKITVRYVFRNTTSKDVDDLIEFPLPGLNGGSLAVIPDEKRLNFVDFRVSCNGKPVATRMEARAFFKGRDVTARLRADGLPISVRYRPVLSAILKLAPARRKQMEKEEMIWQPNTNVWIAGWTERVKFYWRQRFPANRNVVLVQSYRPIPGGSMAADDSSTVKPYCGGADALRRIAQTKHLYPLEPNGDVVMVENDIDFILTTGNDWSGPIRHFRLIVKSDSPQDIVLTCMPGLKRIGPTRYELTRTNFHPKSDLKLLILQPKPFPHPSFGK